MINHVVFFKFKPGTADSEIDLLESELSALPASIREIKKYEMGRDVMKSDRSYDFALIGRFDDLRSLKRYAEHPDHVKVLKHVGQICDSVKTVDFEIRSEISGN